jgi:hypothetical protein
LSHPRLIIRTKFAPGCCLLAALWLAACAAAPVEQQPLARAPDPVQNQAAALPGPSPQIAALNDSPAASPAILKAPQSAVDPEPAPSPPRRAMEPQQLIGLNRAGLSRLLGKPAGLRRETPAEVWRYSAGGCVLHLFLYRNGAGGPYRVVHVDAVRRGQKPSLRPAGISAMPFRKDCLNRLLHRALARNKTS